MKKRWKLDAKDVYTGGMGGTSSCPGSKHGPRVKSAEITLTHSPTGVSVQGNIAPVIQSKKQWKETYQKRWDQLFAELEIKVAAHLKISGISKKKD